MKSVTISLSLPADLHEWSERRYKSLRLTRSTYFGQLIAKDKKDAEKAGGENFTIVAEQAAVYNSTITNTGIAPERKRSSRRKG